MDQHFCDLPGHEDDAHPFRDYIASLEPDELQGLAQESEPLFEALLAAFTAYSEHHPRLLSPACVYAIYTLLYAVEEAIDKAADA